MRFLRSDDHHVDSCWITWNHPDTRMKVTIYPMVHVGHQSFYDRVSADLARCRYVLYEGVSWRLGDERRPLYDLLARNLGIAAQEKALRMPAGATKLNLDMTRTEFRGRFLRLPLRYIVMFIGLRPLLWLATLPRPLRGHFIRHGLLRRHRTSEFDDDRPLTQLLLKTRDKRIVENLTTFCRTTGRTDESAFTGIVFGAGHMPAIAAGLRALGYRPGTRRWVEVFRHVTIGHTRDDN